MRLPSIKKILREDLKEAPAWIDRMIDPLNNFMESVYQALNKNITFQDNINSFFKEINVSTPSTYPVMDDINFLSPLKTRVVGVMVSQVYERTTYKNPPGPVSAPLWVQDGDTIIVKPLTGLEANKSYFVRLLVI